MSPDMMRLAGAAQRWETFLGRYEIGRVAGIPLFVDGSILLFALIWLMPSARDPESLLLGVIILAGVMFSVLLHELGHAFAGRMFGVGSSAIELNGLGGLCFYNSLPPHRLQRVVMALAGPAVTFLVWRFCSSVTNLIAADTFGLDPVVMGYIFYVLISIGQINLFMLIFNLMPSFPLDGGTALKELLAYWLNPFTANWIVGCLGMLVAAACVYLGTVLGYGSWMLLMAFLLFMANYQKLQHESRPPWQRWN
jgi:Zn-dependent protease